MQHTHYSRRGALAVLSSLALLPLQTRAQPLPKVIRLVVPYAAGGGTDILARRLAEALAAELGTSVLVENKAGAGGNIGAQEVIRSAADGSTLLMGDLALAVNPSLFKKLPFDPLKDLAPVALVGNAPLVLVVPTTTGVKSVKDLVALAKANPGKLTFASAGNGNPPHLAGELFRLTTQTEIVHVPYKGVGPALTDLLGGHVTMMFTGISSTRQHIEGGKLNALAVTGAQRAPTLPGVPTIAEAGFAAANVTSWWAVYGPAGLPVPLGARYATAIERALKSPAVQAKLDDQNIVAAFGSADALRSKLQSETRKWAELVRAASLTAD